jgi:hypothetical protein
VKATPSYTTGGIAGLLHVSADTVRRHWPEWHRAKGFPKPLPLPTDSPRAILRWDAAAFDAWRTLQGGNNGAADAIDTTDWAAVARARGLALDRGESPDLSA